MTEHDTKLAAVLAMCELFRPPTSDDAANLYVATLNDIPASLVVEACARLAATAKFRPVPAEVREACGYGLIRAQDRAALAFQALKVACQRVGAFRSPDFDDPLINATVRNLGGWTRACEIPESEFDTWYRKDFCGIYEMFCRTGATPEQSATLEGQHEQQNRLDGYPTAETPVATGLPWAGTVPRLEGPR
jgi:hypothetical protein